MIIPNPNDDVFYITWSRKKIWVYAALCWTLAALFALPSPLLVYLIMNADNDSTLNVIAPLILLSMVTLLFAWAPSIFLRRRHKPLAILGRDSIQGYGKWWRTETQEWKPQTKLYRYRVLTSFQSDKTQSQLSKILWGPRHFVMVNHILAKQKPEEIEAAIQHLNPYA